MLGKELVIQEQLPEIPKNWIYENSVEKVKPLIYTWKNLTLEIATELYIAREVLSHEGKPPIEITGTNVPVSVTWASYCEIIGLEKRTANRWLASVFGPQRLPSPPLPKLESQVLYADPPWAFDNSGFEQSVEQQYSTLSLEEVCNFTDGEITVKQLSKVKESVLFLWVPEALLPDGLQVLRAWGFEYKAQMVWKKNKAPGMGWWVNSKHELLFIGARGTELHPATKYDSVFEAPVTDHSRKPHIVYEMIEGMYTGPYIELFARNTRPGWGSWGNEI